MTVPQEIKLARHAGDLDDDGHDTFAGSAVAADVTIVDAGGYFTATDVEAALQELAKKDLGYTAHGALGTTETFSALTGWHSGTFSANCTATFSGATSGLAASMLLELTSDGSSVMTWPGSVIWASGTAPTLSTTIGDVDVILFMSRDGGTAWYGFPTGTGATGTVTSVALTVPAEFSIAGSPVTSSGTLAMTKATETANTVWAGPTSGSAAQPVFRALVAADIPAGVAGIGGHEHVVSEAHLSDGSTTLYTLDQAFEDGSVIAWNTTTLARLGVTEAQPDQATVSAAGSSGDTIMFDYAATVV